MSALREPVQQDVKLIWCGPLRTGNLQEVLSDLRPFQESHVYFYILEYPTSSVVYVGRAGDFLKRMLEHYRNFLGLAYWLRDEKAKKNYEPSTPNLIKALDDVRTKVNEAADEVERLKFFCAPCCVSRLKEVEAALMHRVMERIKKGQPGLTRDNTRREYHGWDGAAFQIRNEADLSFAEASEYLDMVFGKGAIVWGRKVS